MKVCVYLGASLQSKWREKFVGLLELIMVQQSEIMPGWCFSSPLIKMEILIMQKALCEVRNNGEYFVVLSIIITIFKYEAETLSLSNATSQV